MNSDNTMEFENKTWYLRCVPYGATLGKLGRNVLNAFGEDVLRPTVRHADENQSADLVELGSRQIREGR